MATKAAIEWVHDAPNLYYAVHRDCWLSVLPHRFAKTPAAPGDKPKTWRIWIKCRGWQCVHVGCKSEEKARRIAERMARKIARL